MESTPRLDQTLVYVFSQQQSWVDLRHLQTLAWMIVGLIQSGTSSLTAWTPSGHSRAVQAPSIGRRFARWLENDRIEGHALQGPLMPQAFAAWGSHLRSLARDPSILWTTSGVVRLALVYRGRAVPLVWNVLEHPSRRVADAIYQDGLDRVAERLPCRCPVVLTAERGFADTPLMAHLARWGWHWRLRINGRFWLYREGKRGGQVTRLPWSLGQALFWHWGYLTKQRYGPVHSAMARCHEGQAYGLVVSDAPTEVKTFEEYGWRFDSEANVLDDQSPGFQLESSLLRAAAALERLGWVLAITMLSLVAQGPEVVQQGKRRWVAPPWFRGQSYLKIGWPGVTLALSRGDQLVTRGP